MLKLSIFLLFPRNEEDALNIIISEINNENASDNNSNSNNNNSGSNSAEEIFTQSYENRRFPDSDEAHISSLRALTEYHFTQAAIQRHVARLNDNQGITFGSSRILRNRMNNQLDQIGSDLILPFFHVKYYFQDRIDIRIAFEINQMRDNAVSQETNYIKEIRHRGHILGSDIRLQNIYNEIYRPLLFNRSFRMVSKGFMYVGAAMLPIGLAASIYNSGQPVTPESMQKTYVEEHLLYYPKETAQAVKTVSKEVSENLKTVWNAEEVAKPEISKSEITQPKEVLAAVKTPSEKLK